MFHRGFVSFQTQHPEPQKCVTNRALCKDPTGTRWVSGAKDCKIIPLSSPYPKERTLCQLFLAVWIVAHATEHCNPKKPAQLFCLDIFESLHLARSTPTKQGSQPNCFTLVFWIVVLAAQHANQANQPNWKKQHRPCYFGYLVA